MRYAFYVPAVVIALGLVAFVPAAVSTIYPGSRVSASDPGFHPDTGQINLGYDPRVPSDAPNPPPLATLQQVRAALMMPDPGLTSLGGAPSPMQTSAAPTSGGSETVGAPPSTAAASAPPGPIGATLQTMPAKFSQRNDVLDRVRLMAWPLRLTDQQRQQIFQAVMATTSQPAAGTDDLKPADSLSAHQAADDMHPLPDAIRGMAALQGLNYIKAKNKVLLVEPATRTVVDEIGS